MKLKYRTSEKDEWEETYMDIINPFSLAEFLAEQEYEGGNFCDWEYRVQIRNPDGSERWYTVTADLRFDAIED